MNFISPKAYVAAYVFPLRQNHDLASGSMLSPDRVALKQMDPQKFWLEKNGWNFSEVDWIFTKMVGILVGFSPKCLESESRLKFPFDSMYTK